MDHDDLISWSGSMQKSTDTCENIDVSNNSPRYKTEETSLDNTTTLNKNEALSAGKDDIYNWVGVHEIARGRQYQGVCPLTLSVLKKQLRRQHPHLPVLTSDNTRQLCQLVDSLELQLFCE